MTPVMMAKGRVAGSAPSGDIRRRRPGGRPRRSHAGVSGEAKNKKGTGGNARRERERESSPFEREREGNRPKGKNGPSKGDLAQ